MIIYLVCFFLSIFLLYYSNNIKNKIVKKIVIFIALILPCILAGLRKSTIGTDVLIYLKRLFSIASVNSSFTKYLKYQFATYKLVNEYEIGFNFLVYYITKIFNNFQMVLFAIQALITFPIYFGLKKYKSLEKDIWFCMLVFYLMFYNIGFNAMRQFIGIAIAFYGLSCLFNDGSKIKSALFILIATLFHKSSLIGFFIYGLYLLLKYVREKNKKVTIFGKTFLMENVIFTLTIIIGFLVIINFNNLALLISKISFFSRVRYYAGEGISISIFPKKILPILLLYFMVIKNFLNKNKDGLFYTLIFIIGYFILIQIASVNNNAGRFVYMFYMFNIVLFPMLCNTFEDKNNRKIIKTFIIIYLLLYWYFCFDYNGYNETVPYLPFWK